MSSFALKLSSIYTGLVASRLDARADALRNAAAQPQRTALGRDRDLLAATILRATASVQKLPPIAHPDAQLTATDAAQQITLRPTHSILGAAAVTLGATLIALPKLAGAIVGALAGLVVGLGHVVLLHLGLMALRPAGRSADAALELAQRTALPPSPTLITALGASSTLPTPSTSGSRSPHTGALGSSDSSRRSSLDTPLSEDDEELLLFAWYPERFVSLGFADGTGVQKHTLEPGAWYPAEGEQFADEGALSRQFLLDVVRPNGPLLFERNGTKERIDTRIEQMLPNAASFNEQLELAQQSIGPLLTQLCADKPHWAHAVSQLTHQGFWGELFNNIADSWHIDGRRVRMPLMHKHLSGFAMSISAPGVGTQQSAVQVRGEVVWQPRLGAEHGIEELELVGDGAAAPLKLRLDPHVLPAQPLRAVATLLIPEPQLDEAQQSYLPVAPKARIELTPHYEAAAAHQAHFSSDETRRDG